MLSKLNFDGYASPHSLVLVFSDITLIFDL